MSEMADAIRALSTEKGIDENSIKATIERMIVAAYQKSFGKSYNNCVVKFSDDLTKVDVYSRKIVVDGVYDSIIEIEYDEAKALDPKVEIGDEFDVLIDPKKDFERGAVSVGKQEAHKDLNENSSKRLLDEYKAKVGQIIIGYFQRENKGNIYVDLGKVEGVLPTKYQSPRESYDKNDRIKAIIHDVKKISGGIQIVLSRTDEEFVKKIFELEVPEIADGTISIKSVAREAGYRTKIAVYSNKEGVEPIGACVGLKGVRITNVIRELEGEKIDVLHYDEDPHAFITNALSPAQVKQVIIKDFEKREALAIVDESDFSIAIGKLGQNVRLANKLCDWTIDVKTESMASEEDLIEDNSSRQAAESLFVQSEVSEDLTSIVQLPGVDQRVAELIKAAGFDEIEKFIDAYEDGSLESIEGLSVEDIEAVNTILSEYVEIEEEPSEEPVEEEEEYFCPECGAKITTDMTKCPKCGVEFAFE